MPARRRKPEGGSQAMMIKRGGPGGPRAVGTGAKLDPKTLKRLVGYIFKNYKLRFFIVFICIIVNAVAGVAGSLFLKELINEHIIKMVEVKQAGGTPDTMGLVWALVRMGCIYLAGIIAAFMQQRLMVVISQGVQKTIRDEMFEKMQSLPISYFDRNTHGDIMSHYTNDIDTLRQMQYPAGVLLRDHDSVGIHFHVRSEPSAHRICYPLAFRYDDDNRQNSGQER